LPGKRIYKTLLMTRLCSVLVGLVSAFSFPFAIILPPYPRDPLLSRHTVTFVDNQRLAKDQPVTFSATNRNYPVTFALQTLAALEHIAQRPLSGPWITLDYIGFGLVRWFQLSAFSLSLWQAAGMPNTARGMAE
jgi:hypothetical protein